MNELEELKQRVVDAEKKTALALEKAKEADHWKAKFKAADARISELQTALAAAESRITEPS